MVVLRCGLRHDWRGAGLLLGDSRADDTRRPGKWPHGGSRYMPARWRGAADGQYSEHTESAHATKKRARGSLRGPGALLSPPHFNRTREVLRRRGLLHEKPASNGILPSGHPPLINGVPSNTFASGGSVATGGIALVSGKRKRSRAPYFGVFLTLEGHSPGRRFFSSS